MLPSIALTALLPLLLPFTYAAPSPPADPAALAARGPGDVWINSATIVTADTNRLKLRKGDKSKIDMNEHASSLVNLPIGQDEGEVGFVVWTKKEGAECTFKGKSTKTQSFTFSATADDKIKLHQCGPHDGAKVVCNLLPQYGGGWVQCGA